jgi:molybdenum cofactor synthesis domain-containing protein
MEVTIVCIGDELLAGDIADLNSTWLARNLTDGGAIVKRIIVIPDDMGVIVDEIKKAYESSDKVVVTGGLGPTHDDITRYAIARAFGRNVIRDPEGVEVVEKAIAARGRKPMPESYVMADIPEGSEVIGNPVGAAPGFIVNGRVFVFPGVPSEMKAMFELVRNSFTGEKLIVDWLIVQMSESAIVKDLNEAVRIFPAVTFGSYPSTVLRIKMKSYDAEQVKAAKEWLAQRLV